MNKEKKKEIKGYYKVAKGYLEEFTKNENFVPSDYFDKNKVDLMARYIISVWFTCRKNNKDTVIAPANAGVMFLSMFPDYYISSVHVMESVYQIDTAGYHKDPDKDTVFKNLQSLVNVLERENDNAGES